MKTRFLKFSNQEKLTKKQLICIYGGTGDGDDDHTGPKPLKPDWPASPAGGGN